MLNELNGFQGREYDFSSLNAPGPSSKSVFGHILREEPLGLIELAQNRRTSKEGADHI